MCCIFILPPIIFPDIPDDGQEIGRAGSVILVDNLLHGLFPLYEQSLMGLLPTIGQHAILQILLFQIGHVHKRHPAGVEAEHEHVSGIIHGRH